MQLAREPPALVVERRFGALAHAHAHRLERADEQRGPAGHAQKVAEVHRFRGQPREERVVELREPAEHDGDGDPAQQRLAEPVRAAGEPDGGDHERDGDGALHDRLRADKHSGRADDDAEPGRIQQQRARVYS